MRMAECWRNRSGGEYRRGSMGERAAVTPIGATVMKTRGTLMATRAGGAICSGLACRLWQVGMRLQGPCLQQGAICAGLAQQSALLTAARTRARSIEMAIRRITDCSRLVKQRPELSPFE